MGFFKKPGHEIQKKHKKTLKGREEKAEQLGVTRAEERHDT